MADEPAAEASRPDPPATAAAAADAAAAAGAEDPAAPATEAAAGEGAAGAAAPEERAAPEAAAPEAAAPEAAAPEAAATEAAATEAAATEAAGEAAAEPLEPLEPRALVEALLFVSDGPVTSGALARALDVTPRRAERALDALEASLETHGVQLQRGPEGVQLITAPQAAAAVERFLGLESSRRLSTAALETLAVIAYRQPVTRAAIEAIRGTSSDAVIATLRARGLIERVGRAEGPGRPGLYGTTQRFLEHFGLLRASELPGLEEFAERLGVAPPAEQPALIDARATAPDGTPLFARGAAGPNGAPPDATAASEFDLDPAGAPPAEEGADGAPADEPGVNEPGVNEPGVNEPGVDKPGVDEPGADEPGADEPPGRQPSLGL